MKNAQVALSSRWAHKSYVHLSTNMRECTSSKDLHRPMRLRCLIRIFAVRLQKFSIFDYPRRPQLRFDQTMRMRRLIGVCAGRV